MRFKEEGEQKGRQGAGLSPGETGERERGREEEREIEAEGVGVEALRDTTPVASTRLPKEPPFGNRPPESTCRPLAPRVGGRN